MYSIVEGTFMIQIPASTARKDFAQVMDSAQKESVIVRKHDRDYVAIISMEDYEQLVRMKNQRLKILAEHLGREARDNGLTPEILTTILNNNA
jgi:prevent-host-death family protein